MVCNLSRGIHFNGVMFILFEQFVMNDAWQVAAGEESEEVKAQKLRATRVLEAVYPRLSAIPPK